ncbi:MAG TPA: putative Ig domain-containing protein, partial [Verrucomicrobiae bacterium]|nr:putative Ig domain-containing protein [Verrucomicrobiae bacterium]
MSAFALPAPRRRTTGKIWFLVVLLCLALMVSTTHGQTNTAFSGFTQPFDPTKTNILFTTANTRGFFHVGDPIGLATIDGSPLNVFAWYGDLLYSGPATNLYLPAGHYFVEAPGDRNEFAVLPADWSTLSRVGWDCDFEPDPTILATASFLKLGWVRGAFEWDVIQAGGSNSWDWSSTDQIISAHHGLRKIEMTLEGAPAWMTDPSTGAWKISTARFAQLFAQFAQAAGQRYSNLVDVVEVWNEPCSCDLPTTNNTDEANLYVTMLAATRAAFPPSVKLSGPASNSPFFLSQGRSIAAAGGTPYLDYDVYHDYAARNGAPDIDSATNAAWRTIPQRVQDNFAIFGKPIIVDEVGLYGLSALGAPNSTQDVVECSSLSWTTGLTYTIKYAVMYAANNVIPMPHEFLSSTTIITNNQDAMGFDVNGRGPHPKTSAFLMSEYWINGATFVDWRSPGTQVFLYAWQPTNNTSLVFAWTVDGQSFPLSTNSAFTITDVYGRSIQPSVLTAQPILFHTNSPNAAALLQSVMDALPNLNLPPVMGQLSNQTALKSQLLQFSVPAADPDNDPLTYSASSLPTGASLNPTNGTFSWIPTASQLGTYSITFTATDARGLSTSTTTLISVLGSSTDGLVDWWKFDELSGTTAADSAGSDPGVLSNFTFTTTSGWVTGHIGNALAFNGSNDFVRLDSSQLNFTNNFSVSVWLRPHDALLGQGSFLSVRSRYASSGFNFEINKNDFALMGQTTAGYQLIGFFRGQFQNDTWYHVVVVYDKSVINVYVNGVALTADNGQSPNWGGDIVMDPTASSKIGAENGGSNLGFVFNGLIDDLRIYNRTLAPAEVLALYQADQPPVLTPISDQTVAAGQPLAFTLSATDPDSTNLTFSAVPLPGGATFSTSTGFFGWTPSLSQTGAYAVTFSVTDGLLTNSQTASITVTGGVSQVADQPPALTPISDQTVAAGQPLAFTLSATDPDSTNLTFFAAPLPDGATVSASTGAFSWTPTLSQTGAYAVTFSVTDGLL